MLATLKTYVQAKNDGFLRVHIHFLSKKVTTNFIKCVPFVVLTVIKIRAFSVVNRRVLHGQCDRLRHFLTLFLVVNCGHFQALIADNFGILAQENKKNLNLYLLGFEPSTSVRIWLPMYYNPPLAWKSFSSDAVVVR